MSVPTTTLLKQLAWEVEWLAGDTPCTWEHMQWARDHAEAALDIIEELEGREARAGWQEPLFHTAMNENTRRILESRAFKADLHRLHDLIKGSAGREAMDLIRRMMGEEGKDE